MNTTDLIVSNIYLTKNKRHTDMTLKPLERELETFFCSMGEK
jgi:hypothetical protein